MIYLFFSYSALKDFLSSNKNLECLVLQNIIFREEDINNIAKVRFVYQIFPSSSYLYQSIRCCYFFLFSMFIIQFWFILTTLWNLCLEHWNIIFINLLSMSSHELCWSKGRLEIFNLIKLNRSLEFFFQTHAMQHCSIACAWKKLCRQVCHFSQL